MPVQSGDHKQNNKQVPDKSDEAMYQRNLFMSLALDMTWQLALVVIVPIVGSYFLEKHYHAGIWLLIAGFVVAAIGVFGVLNRVVTVAGRRSGYGKNREDQ